jgi:hypothetical protein
MPSSPGRTGFGWGLRATLATQTNELEQPKARRARVPHQLTMLALSENERLVHRPMGSP